MNLPDEICEKNHEQLDIDILESLPKSQKAAGRHRCAACAYEMGYEDGQRTTLALLVKEEEEASRSKQCSVCGELMSVVRSTKTTCSDRCRQQFHREKGGDK